MDESTLDRDAAARLAIGELRSAPLEIIGVIDLIEARLVRAIAGRRSEYRPWVSPLCPDSLPATFMANASSRLGVRRFYIADLDAIQGGEPDWRTLEDLALFCAPLWIDAGVRARARLARMLATAAHVSVVLALECLSAPDDLASLVAEADRERIIFSVDLRLGRSLGSKAWPECPLETARIAYDLGIRQFIVLDLAAVGVAKGCPTLELCGQIAGRFGDVQLTTGGGMRGAEDFQAAAKAGCQAALVASLLHASV